MPPAVLLAAVLAGLFFSLGIGAFVGYLYRGKERGPSVLFLAALVVLTGLPALVGYYLGRKIARGLGWVPWVFFIIPGALAAPPALFLLQMPMAPKFPGGTAWWFITAQFLVIGLCYVAWMYFRDSHGVGALWASLLGLLRATVFCVLAFFFMLPAVRDYKDSFSRSKVLVLFDVSGSMAGTIDDIPTDAVPLDKLLSRQDKVIQFLNDEKVNFVKRLEEKNPVDVFRFARGLDPEYLHLAQDGNAWMRAEFDAYTRNPNRDKEVIPPGPLAAGTLEGVFEADRRRRRAGRVD